MRTVLIALVLLLSPTVAQAASAPDAGTAFVPTPTSQNLYGTQAPDVQPDVQRHVVTAQDGVDLYVETWLPKAKDGHTPPARVPVVLIATPYVSQGVERYPDRELENVIARFTSRGYAVAQHNIRGTGESGGCLEQTADHQIDDVARVIEYLGKDAPFGDGNVGMYGISYDAETQISTAARGDREKVKYLKAIIPAASVGGQYEYSNIDGVPYTGQATLSNAAYLATTSAAPGAEPNPLHYLEKLTCQPEVLLGGAEPSGDLTPFWQVREYRPDAPKITAAVLDIHGLADFNVLPITEAGWFDRLAPTTPRAGVFGQWEHNYPDNHDGVEPAWARRDVLDMATAWYDRYLKGTDSGVERWPVAQVQGSDGQWRGERGWPITGGPAAQLALGLGGTLGVAAAAGGSETIGPNDSVTFTTKALTAPLEITGQPVADLWVTPTTGREHIGVQLEVLGPDGNVLVHDGSSAQAVADGGARSLAHLAPMPDDYFVQTASSPAAAGVPVRVPVRLLPTDLVVPKGGMVRVTVGGTTAIPRDSLAGLGSVTLLHDCAHPSVLRFRLPAPDAPLLNVGETDEKGTLASSPAVAGMRDGDGLASAPVCGKAPEVPEAAIGVRSELQNPRPSAPATVVCRDTAAPVSRLLGVRATRRGLTVRGSARDTGCGLAPKAKLVRVAAARRVGTRCVWLGASRKPLTCARVPARALRGARGVTRFSVTLKRRLVPGRYLVVALGRDAAGNRERLVRSRTRTVRVR